MTSPFENLTGFGKPLKAEPPDAKEFTGLVRSARARLKDAANEELSLESRFDLARPRQVPRCTQPRRVRG
ncbi:MAG: hypothetical protein U1A72_17225 [Sulfuritalea sp.]|nr:hypothetical protein [Sulfuritalea sp.]